MQWVFGYGSLMYEPELAASVVERRVGSVVGWARRFNKRSTSRGCPTELARVPAVAPAWVRGELRLSLVLGTERLDGGTLFGELLGYPDAVADELRSRLEVREGPGYRHVPLAVHTQRGHVEAWSWFSDPTSSLIVDLDLPAQASVLHAATPVQSPDGRARGANYLLRVERHLHELGHPDPYISALADAVRALG